jgi:hypothetical protein
MARPLRLHRGEATFNSLANHERVTRFGKRRRAATASSKHHLLRPA